MSSMPNTTPVNLTPVHGNGRVVMPARKKRCLNYEKCHDCRRDKQKCLPTTRQWPLEKCNRCAEKDLPCSRPERAGSAARPLPNLAAQERQANRAEDNEDQSTAGRHVSDGEDHADLAILHELQLLLAYSQLLNLAGNELETSEKKLLEVFVHDDDWDDLEPVSISDGCASFWRHVTDLEKVIYRLSVSLEPSENMTPWKRLLLTAMLPKRRFMELRSRNIEVHSLREEAITKTMQIDIGSAFLYQLSRIQIMLCDCVLRPSYDPNKEWSRLNEIWRQFGPAVQGVLQKYDILLGNSLVFLPRAIFRTQEDLDQARTLGFQRDCLNRNLNHIALDYGFVPEVTRANLHMLTEFDVLGRTPLHMALLDRRYDMLQQCLALKVDLNIESDTWTPLGCASATGNARAVKDLLAAGAIPDAVTRCNRTPFWSSVASENYEVMRLLGSLVNVDKNAADNSKNSPLAIAAKRGFKRGVVYLLSCPSVKVNSTDIYRKTPLMEAVLYERPDIVAILACFRGIELDAMDQNGDTALDLAEYEGKEEIVDILEAAGTKEVEESELNIDIF